MRKNMNKEQFYGSIVIISGPSGVGKSTIFHNLQKIHKNLHFSVSCTTRQKRSGELDGMAYHFIDKDTFEQHIRNDDFLEYAEVHGAFYGTLKSELNCIKKGKDLLLDIDTQGRSIIRKKLKRDPFYWFRLVSVFIMPPSEKILAERLRGRGTETEEAIERRLMTGRREMAEWNTYDYVIINEDASVAAQELENIIQASHLSSGRITEETWRNE